MACYLYSEGETQPAILYLQATAIMLARDVLFPILSSLPPDHHRLTQLLKVINCAALMLILYLHYNTILYNVELAMLFC